MEKGKFRQVYMDHAAATPLDPRVQKAMEPYLSAEFFNPSALYAGSIRVRRAIENARKGVAEILHVQSPEIIFTPGGTASDNLAVLGVARAYRQGVSLRAERSNLQQIAASSRQGGTPHNDKPHIVVSAIEHEAVLEPARQLEKEGFAITYVKPDREGIVQPEAVKKALRPETILVSIMYANNEIGTIQPISETAKVIRDFRKIRNRAALPYFHTDACQAANYLDLNVQKLGVDLLTLNGSKIYGPKLSGILYMRKGIPVQPLLFGGGQEKGFWSGTENVAGIVGFSKALEIAEKMKTKESVRLIGLRDYFIEKLQAEIPGISLNGHAVKRLPNNIHLSIKGIDGEAIVLYMDAREISAAIGSACTSQSMEPSHVLKAIGLSDAKARSSIRLTLGRSSTKANCDYVLKQIKEIRPLLPDA